MSALAGENPITAASVAIADRDAADGAVMVR
jgi:hypothetical protein